MHDMGTPEATNPLARILIVENEPKGSAKLAAMLDRMGYQTIVQLATEVTQAIEAISEFGPDVVLMDVEVSKTDAVDDSTYGSAVRLVAPIVLWSSTEIDGKSQPNSFNPSDPIINASYQERELRTVIEFALHRSRNKRQLESVQWKADRSEALIHLAQGAAHELNNLLTVLCINSELVSERPNCSQADHALLKDVSKATERASEITKELLLLGRERPSQT